MIRTQDEMQRLIKVAYNIKLNSIIDVQHKLSFVIRIYRAAEL